MSDWLADERREPPARAELSRAWRRARARPILAFLPALAVALAVVYLRYEASYPARVVLRVVEGELDTATAPRPTRELAEHVRGVVFSDRRLLALIRAEGLYPRQLARGEHRAAESMRDDIDISVWRNEFEEEPDPEEPTRTARVSITYVGKEPGAALRVARGLARLVAEEQQDSRVEAIEAGVSAAEGALYGARAELLRRREQAARRTLEYMASRREPLRAVELSGLLRSTSAVDEEVRTEGREVVALERRRAIERSRLGLRFEIVDEEPPRRGPPRAVALSALGIVTLLFTLPLSAIVVGAFDGRVRDLDDVRRLALVPLGRIRLDGAGPASDKEGRPPRPHRHGG